MAQTPPKPPYSPHVLFNGWGLSPSGKKHLAISDMCLNMVVSPDGKKLLCLSGGYTNTGLTVIDLADEKVSDFIPLPRCFNGLAFSKDGSEVYASGANGDIIYRFKYKDGSVTRVRDIELHSIPGRQEEHFISGLAVHPVTGKIYVCSEGSHDVLVVDADHARIEQIIRVGTHPHSCIFGMDKDFHLYVSNWGSRSVSVIDTAKNQTDHELAVGVRPNAMALSPDGRLFVACSGDNTVHVFKTQKVEAPDGDPDESRPPIPQLHEIISTSLYPSSPEGSTPIGVAISADGKLLYVANADNNDITVVDVSNAEASMVRGFIPVGWYPSCLKVIGQKIFVANGKGDTRASFPAKSAKPNWDKKLRFDSPPKTFAAYVSIIDSPDEKQLGEYTEQVRRNSPYTPENLRKTSAPNQSIIPSELGKDCPIKYVIYIVKENRTYDQILGDLKDKNGKPLGNGDPSICMVGEKITPNQHKLAREFAVLDSLFCNGEVSADGHNWCDYAMATDWRQNQWMIKYSKRGFLPGNDELKFPTTGALWDQCKRLGLTYKCYGEGSEFVPPENRGRTMHWRGPDRESARMWIEDLHEAERKNEFPRFTIMSLPADHTRGTTPGELTPESMIADNDFALGQIVEAASKSKFWKEMAIFVIEDDAQEGPDHVDAHRTVGFVLSPWCKRGIVDSTPYTTTSMIRTMELILGLPPMSQYDAGATPMFNLFSKDCDPTEFKSVPANIDLTKKNHSKSFGAMQSAKMDWDEFDEAPEDELNRILWGALKGPDVPYPVPVHRAVFMHMHSE